MSKFGTDALFLNKKELFKVLLDWEYPIGKGIKITFDNVNPGTYLGGKWEAFPEGYALWTTTTTDQGGKTIAAGLPNIIGMATLSSGIWDSITTEGAFYQKDGITNHAGHTGSSFSQKGYKVRFDASKGGSSLYGKSTTVQPPAIKVYVWKRVG